MLRQKIVDNLRQNNVLTQKGLVEIFDSTIGRSTVLMPFGGYTQRTETQVSVQKLPVGNKFTNTASMMAYGYNPILTKWSPYHGAQYAVVEAITKIVAAGGRYNRIRFSFQEYFEKMTEDPVSWGKPTAALLGALQIQKDFGLPAIGGKDSMSGTFQDINVPPMLMAFGITTVDANNVISTEFKKAGSNIYVIRHAHNEDYTPNINELKKNYDYLSSKIEDKTIISAFAVGFGGVMEAICKMTFGNEHGANIDFNQRADYDMSRYLSDMFDLSYGSVVVESNADLDFDNAIYIGRVTDDKFVRVFQKEEAKPSSEIVSISIDELYKANTEKFAEIYPIKSRSDESK